MLASAVLVVLSVALCSFVLCVFYLLHWEQSQEPCWHCRWSPAAHAQHKPFVFASLDSAAATDALLIVFILQQLCLA